MAGADSAKIRGRGKGPYKNISLLVCTVSRLHDHEYWHILQTAEQDAYDFFTSAIDGDVLDHICLPRRNLTTTTNETRGQGVPLAAVSAVATVGEGELAVVVEEERDEADTSALLEQQVSL